MNIILISFTIIALIGSTQSVGPVDSKFKAAVSNKWNYKDLGPDVWYKSFPDCKLMSQSPIDIDSEEAIYDLTLAPIHFNGKLQEETAWYIKLKPFGVNMDFAEQSEANTVTGSDQKEKPFFLRGVHWHWGYNDHQGSEHYLDNEKFPLEMHMVTQDKEGNYRVVGYFFEMSNKNNDDFEPVVKAMHKFDRSLPLDLSQRVDFDFDFSSFLPHDQSSYYRYSGSFTTPPCTEGVFFSIMKETIKISNRQLMAFHNITNTFYGQTSNFREPQPLNGRKVFKSFLSGTDFHCNSFRDCLVKWFGLPSFH